MKCLNIWVLGAALVDNLPVYRFRQRLYLDSGHKFCRHELRGLFMPHQFQLPVHVLRMTLALGRQVPNDLERFMRWFGWVVLWVCRDIVKPFLIRNTAGYTATHGILAPALQPWAGVIFGTVGACPPSSYTLK